ncbi:MAG: TIGR04348 family glycosyltransferase [Acidobacteria bacterium]|nr:MAG: TIGR04348 family glycosyltransferase [Acidobacteriota bacterium]
MRAVLVAASHLGRQSGNSVTAVRWQSILQDLGWNTTLHNQFNGESADLMIALNAYRSAESILTFRDRYPDRALIVALTGTDLYRFLRSDPEKTTAAVAAADRLVVLNNLAPRVLAADQRDKCFVILESADPLPAGRKPLTRHFDVCVVGHLREEKDPLLAADAVRGLPSSSRIRVRHYGRAHTRDWNVLAQKEMEENPRYTWFGEVSHWQIRRALSTSRLMVVSSIMEGGPNCLSEAIAAGLPAVTTDIDGCVGVLGEAYPGYFPVGNSRALTDLLLRAEQDSAYLYELEEAVAVIAPQFTREQERRRWAKLLNDLLGSKSPHD